MGIRDWFPWVRGCGLVATVAIASGAQAETIEVAPGDDVEAAINGLSPGDELVLSGGMYELDDVFHALAYDPVDNVFIFVTDGDSGQRTWAYRLAR